MKTLQVQVAGKQPEAEGIASFTLRAPDGGQLPAFTAGAHIDVHVAPGLVRQYSLCNPPVERDHYRIAVLREPSSRGGSAGMHDSVSEGQMLTISEPKNHFPLVPAARVLLLAGGIGITPLLAMAHTLHAQGTPFELHYCCRSLARVAFKQALEQAPFASSVRVHLDDAEPAQRFQASAVLADPKPDAHVYVCGPAGFIAHVLETANACGWPDEQVHREYFGAATQDTADDGAFDIQLSSTGERIHVSAKQSALEALLAHGLDMPYSCEAGVCGTCLTGVREGTPDHRDSFLTDKERAQGTQFLPCCSRSKSPLLVLDL